MLNCSFKVTVVCAEAAANTLVSTPFSTTEIFAAGTCRCFTRKSLKAGVTTTMWSEREYKKFAMAERDRCRIEFSAPSPTAVKDSGQRSRTSNTKGTFLRRASHQPERPTRSWGEVAMMTSGWGRLMPRTAADKQNDA